MRIKNPDRQLNLFVATALFLCVGIPVLIVCGLAHAICPDGEA